MSADTSQAAAEVARDTEASFWVEEPPTLTRRSNDAFAGEVLEHVQHRDAAIARIGRERLINLARQVESKLSTAMLAFDVLTKGGVGLSGSAVTVLGQSLNEIRGLLDRALAEGDPPGLDPSTDRSSVEDAAEETRIEAAMIANARCF